MTRESLVLAVSGAFFGLLVGWMLGSQQAPSPGAFTPPPTVASASASTAGAGSARPALDEVRAGQLQAQAERDTNDSTSRVELGNMYFDAERYTEAIVWYEAALAIDPSDPNVSTDLGVAYYYTDDPDRALAQFARSLESAPDHVKTLLNTGIVRAFGKQDLAGAAESWQRVIDIAPDSPEGRAARQAIESMRGAHAGIDGAGDEPRSGGTGGG